MCPFIFKILAVKVQYGLDSLGKNASEQTDKKAVSIFYISKNDRSQKDPEITPSGKYVYISSVIIKRRGYITYYNKNYVVQFLNIEVVRFESIRDGDTSIYLDKTQRKWLDRLFEICVYLYFGIME